MAGILAAPAVSVTSPDPAGWDGGGGKVEEHRDARRPRGAGRGGAEGGSPPCCARAVARSWGAAGPGAANRERCGGASDPRALREVPALGFRERLRSGSALSLQPTSISFKKNQLNEEKRQK